MRIGFDFDNTIVNYDFVFTEIAKELQLDYLHSPKNSIKNYYEIQLGQPNSWKKVQFKVYCELISNIPASDNFIILLYWLIDNKHDIFIISHKTKNIKINKMLAQVLVKSEQYKEALDIYHKIVVNNPSDVESQFAEGLVYLQLNQDDQAETLLLQLFRGLPNWKYYL